MWAYYTVLTYFVLALLVPIVLALGGAYHRARRERSVFCPADQERSLVQLDAAYAARMHALGNPEARIKLCSRWPERQACARDCLEQIHPAA